MSLCPICNKNARSRAANPAYPFCSPRCKQVDLYHWLNEDYRVPAVDQTPPEDAEPAPKSKEN